MATALHHVSGIVGGRASEKVQRVGAWWIVTAMPNDYPSGNRPVQPLVGKAMDVVGVVVLKHNAITRTVRLAKPSAAPAIGVGWFDEVEYLVNSYPNRPSHNSMIAGSLLWE